MTRREALQRELRRIQTRLALGKLSIPQRIKLQRQIQEIMRELQAEPRAENGTNGT